MFGLPFLLPCFSDSNSISLKAKLPKPYFNLLPSPLAEETLKNPTTLLPLVLVLKMFEDTFSIGRANNAPNPPLRWSEQLLAANDQRLLR